MSTTVPLTATWHDNLERYNRPIWKRVFPRVNYYLQDNETRMYVSARKDRTRVEHANGTQVVPVGFGVHE